MLRHATIAIALLSIVSIPAQMHAQSATPQDARVLAKRIDKIIEQRLKKDKVKAGLRAGDAEIARRLHIDLTGRIPTLLQIGDYLDNDSPDRYARRVEDLLASPLFAANFTHYYRSIMLTGTNNVQIQGLDYQFEGWLHDRLSKNMTYDKIAAEIVTAQINQGGFTPQAFYFANENKAENLAGATARIFLGVKIECAQCHKHPFAKWTRQQFWEYAAFFVNTQQVRGRIGGGGLVGGGGPDVREIKIPDTDKVVQAKFITGETPEWKDGVPTRAVFAEWMTAPKNPYFAKAAVDHVWQYFFGVSLTEPIFEPTDDTPAHPVLLEELSKSFIASGYDLKFLIRAIVLTDAYQRTSIALNEKTQEEIQLFAKMPVRGMMPEQLFDCFAEATDNRQDVNYNDPNRQPNFGLPGTPRQQFLAKFTSQDKRIETQTSILQALFVMNGKWLADRVKLENNTALRTVATSPITNARRVETLYMMVLSRRPRAEELKRMVDYIEKGGGSHDSRQAVADIYWALLNGSEFALNH